MPDYLIQSSQQTLRAAVEEYSQTFSDQLTSRMLSEDAKRFFRSHDVVHVVFGCGLTLQDEVVVKISSFFGTTGGFEVIRGYRLPESKEIYDALRWWEIMRTTALSLVLVPQTISRCFRMRRRWPWRDFDVYLDTPLVELRKQFGISVPNISRA
ncbi:MAG: hypothetical protein AAF541_08960 [Pseudomonadota bacterium]